MPVIANKLPFQNHPELVRNWDIYRAQEAFTNGHTWEVSRYLVRHPSESDNSAEGTRNFTTRLARLYNVNFCAPFLQQHHAHMSQPMTIAGADHTRMKPVVKDVTGFGVSAERMARDRLYYYLQNGRCGTLVDGPARIARSRSVARANNERSYQVLYTARQIRFWDYFESGPRKGQLRSVILEEKPFFDPEKNAEVERFRWFFQPEAMDAPFKWAVMLGQDVNTPGLVQSFDPTTPWWTNRPNQLITAGPQDLEVIDSGVGSLSYIPFFIMGEGPEESFIHDVWQLNLTHMNLLSVLSNIIYNQGFQKSIFAGVAKEELSKMGEWLATIVSNSDARIFTIDPGNPEACFQELSNLAQQIERRAKFEFNQLADDTRQVQSASSKSKDLITRQAIYDQTVDLWTEVERRIYMAHAEYEGAPVDSIDVHIDRDYGLDDYRERETELLTIFNQARELNVPDLQKEVLKTRVAKIRFLPRDGKSEEEVRDEMLKAIDAAEPLMAQATTAVRSLGYKTFGGQDKVQGEASMRGANQGPPQAQKPTGPGKLYGDTTGISAPQPAFPKGD